MDRIKEILSSGESFRIIYSGAEVENYFNILYNAGIKNFLMSFHYVQDKQINMEKRFYGKEDIQFFIDSGAHTYQQYGEYENCSIEFWEDYIRKYLNWVEQNKKYIFAIANLDIENLVGDEVVRRWNEKFFIPFMQRTGIPVCFVWHENSFTDWKWYCKQYSYVGLSAVTTEGKNHGLSEYLAKLNVAKRYGTLVHGFGMTQIELLTKIPFFTVDSTTWLVGTKYGELNFWDGRTWKRLKKDQWKRQYKNKLIKLGANWELAEKENPYELIRINLLVFKKAEEDIRKRLRPKMYWLKQGVKESMSLKKINKKEEIKEEISIGENPVKKKSSLKKIFKDAPPTKLKKSTKKEVPDRDDLGGKSKFEEFMEGSQKKVTEKEIKFPDLDWFNGDCDDYLDYCKSLNISINTPKEEAIQIIKYMTLFLTNNTDIIDNDELIELCDFHFNDIFANREERIKKLQKFYKDNVERKRNDFAGDEIEDALEKPKERNEYYVEDEYEVVDVYPEELSNLLPAPKEGKMPEVEELDEELNDLGIVPVRDEQGRFIKGQRKVRKPKNIYSELYPKLACDTCYKSGECPEYAPGYVCKFHKLFKRFDTRNIHDVLDAMRSMTNMNLERMQRLAIFEVMDGGMLDPNLSALIDQNLRILTAMKDLIVNKTSLLAEQRTLLNSDGSVETITRFRENPGETGGILAKLFGNPSAPEKSEENGVANNESDDIIDVEPISVE